MRFVFTFFRFFVCSLQTSTGACRTLFTFFHFQTAYNLPCVDRNLPAARGARLLLADVDGQPEHAGDGFREEAGGEVHREAAVALLAHPLPQDLPRALASGAAVLFEWTRGARSLFRRPALVKPGSILRSLFLLRSKILSYQRAHHFIPRFERFQATPV